MGSKHKWDLNQLSASLKKNINGTVLFLTVSDT